MEKYIPLDVLVAEIEKLKEENKPNSKSISEYIQGGIYGFDLAIEKTLGIIETLVAKEVDLEKEINYWQGCEAFPEGVGITPLPKAMEIVEKTAKHFFELGLKVAQKGEL